MHKLLIALNVLLLTVALVLASDRSSSQPVPSHKWDMQTAVTSEMVPDLSKFGSGDAEAMAELKKTVETLKPIAEKAEKQFAADKKALLDKGYEPFAVGNSEMVIASGMTAKQTTVYFKKLLR